MKRILFVILACVTLAGCKGKEFDLPKPLTELEHTKWFSSWSTMSEDDAVLLIGKLDANYWTNDDAMPSSQYLGEGVISSMDSHTIVFSDFVATSMYRISAIKIEKAEYTFKNEYLHILTMHYREDLNQLFDPSGNPERHWSDVKTREFMLYNENIHGSLTK